MIGGGRRLLGSALLLVCGASTARAQAPVAPVGITFPGADLALTLTGRLHRPEGSGPFPALVRRHGGDGITPTDQWGAERLRGWGHVTLLVVDPGTPHGVSLPIYPHHAFDRMQSGTRMYLGHTLERHPEAALDALNSAHDDRTRSRNARHSESWAAI